MTQLLMLGHFIGFSVRSVSETEEARKNNGHRVLSYEDLLKSSEDDQDILMECD